MSSWLPRALPRRIGRCVLGAAPFLISAGAGAEPPPEGRAIVDRVVVRFYAPETGGATRPRFVTERMLAFEARLEALAEDPDAEGYQDRHVRAAMDHHVAEELLASLSVEGGTEPPDLPRLATAGRTELAARAGGEARLQAAALAEGIAPREIDAMLRRSARAAYYVDKNVSPMLHPTDEQLREVFRTSAHPFKNRKYDDAKADLGRWLVAERLRVAETSFLQTARSRVKILVVPH